jgi:hypothetical protein
MCKYIFMATYSFLPPLRKAKFCGLPSCVVDNVACAAAEKRLQNTTLLDPKTSQSCCYETRKVVLLGNAHCMTQCILFEVGTEYSGCHDRLTNTGVSNFHTLYFV